MKKSIVLQSLAVAGQGLSKLGFKYFKGGNIKINFLIRGSRINDEVEFTNQFFEWKTVKVFKAFPIVRFDF